MMSPTLSHARVSFPTPVAYDFEALDRTALAILGHRRLLRRAGPVTNAGLDRVDLDLDRARKTLGVVSSRERAGTVTTALLRAYRWLLESASQFADLEAASLDRELTPSELELFARRSTAAYVCVVEPSFRAAQASDETSEERALSWDIDTAKVAIARALVSIHQLA